MLHLSKPTDSRLKACAAFYAAAFGAPPWNEESDEAALAAYFDYEAYGRDIRMEAAVTYTSYGCVIDNR